MRLVICARRVLLLIENLNVPHSVGVLIGHRIDSKQLCLLNDGDLLLTMLDFLQFRSAKNFEFTADEGHATEAMVPDVSVTLMGKTCDDSGPKSADLATISSPTVEGGISTLLRFCQSFLPITARSCFWGWSCWMEFRPLVWSSGSPHMQYPICLCWETWAY